MKPAPWLQFSCFRGEALTLVLKSLEFMVQTLNLYFWRLKFQAIYFFKSFILLFSFQKYLASGDIFFTLYLCEV